MSSRIIPQDITQRNTPPNTPAYLDKPLTPALLRNRRLLAAALATGIRIVGRAGSVYAVQSAGARYQVLSWTNDDGARVEQCSCDWAARHLPCETYNRFTKQISTNNVLPCKHILLVRFWQLDGIYRAALLIDDPELRAAFLCGQRGLDGPAPAGAAAVALQEVAA